MGTKPYDRDGEQCDFAVANLRGSPTDGCRPYTDRRFGLLLSLKWLDSSPPASAIAS